MIKATTMAELEQELFVKALPDEVIKELLFTMFRIEREFGIGGNDDPPVAFVIVAESEEEREQAAKEFGLQGRKPDDSDMPYADASAVWFSETFADEGGGEIDVFTRYARACEKRTQTARNAPPQCNGTD